MDTSNYIPEPTAFANNDAILSAFDWIYGANNFSDEEMLATMQAIKNPTWWSNMMMPGYGNAALFLLLFPLYSIVIYIILDSLGLKGRPHLRPTSWPRLIARIWILECFTQRQFRCRLAAIYSYTIYFGG